MEQTILPVLVSFHSPLWIKVGLGSYRRHFPDGMVLVVDNNPDPGSPGWSPECEEERAWLKARPDVLLVKNHGPLKGHGTGVDVAVTWCRQNGVEFLLHFEPDCLITGRRWFEELYSAVEQGAWMAGSHRKHYGPIHPTPSLWRVSQIQTSFEAQTRGNDLHHPRFSELFALEWLVGVIRDEGGHWEWWRDHWDTAQRAWFQAAVHDRAALAPETDDFTHYWCGSTNRDHPALRSDARILDLLRSSQEETAPVRTPSLPPCGGGLGWRVPGVLRVPLVVFDQCSRSTRAKGSESPETRPSPPSVSLPSCGGGLGWRVPAQSESASFSPQKEAPAPPHVSASGSGVVPWQLDAPLTSPSGKPSPTTDHRPRFCVVTPTIPGRERLLKAAIASVQAQDFRDLQHWVVGDGPCPEAESLCASLGVRFLHTPAREDAWGSNARNLVLDQADADYFVFLDDDNLLFRHSLARLHDTAAEHRDPPLLAQRILFLPRTAEPYRVLPESLPPQLGQWDQLCACIRGDIARRVRFVRGYTQDYVYIQDCIAASHVQPLLVEEIGGVHT